MKFHLDRLVEEDLLDVEFRRLSGRSGPGAGRPAKLYRRSDRQLSVSIPARRYDLAGDVLAEAVDRSVREGVAGPGRRPVRRLRARAPPGCGRGGHGGRRPAPPSSSAPCRSWRARGYEPRVVGEQVVLANCPFDRLARNHTELVCGLNLALVEGVLQGLGCTALQAALDPRPGRCCVTARVRV